MVLRADRPGSKYDARRLYARRHSALATLSPPEGYSVASIMQKISDGLTRNGIRGVYGFGNSWSLAQQPELAAVLDAWVADGHHVGNHTHSHITIN